MKLYDEWKTNGNWSTFNAKSEVDNQISNRASSRSRSDFFINTSGYSVVGIKVSEIIPMRMAITTYVNAIKNHLDQIEPLADANNAFRSIEVQKAVRQYIGQVKTYCMNLISKLLAFSDKLQEVSDKYEENMQALADNINNSSNSLNTGDAYQIHNSGV